MAEELFDGLARQVAESQDEVALEHVRFTYQAVIELLQEEERARMDECIALRASEIAAAAKVRGT